MRVQPGGVVSVPLPLEKTCAVGDLTAAPDWLSMSQRESVASYSRIAPCPARIVRSAPIAKRFAAVDDVESPSERDRKHRRYAARAAGHRLPLQSP